MAERLTAEERAGLRETLKRFTLGKGQIRIILDSLDAAEAEVTQQNETIAMINFDRKNFHEEAKVLKAEIGRLRKELTWIVECGTDYQSINRSRSALVGGEPEC